MKKLLKPVVLALAYAGITHSSMVVASGFALIEQNASGAGNAYAGGAAAAEDASTIFYNPAGLTRIKGSQFIAAGHIIDVGISFSKDRATTALSTNLTGGDGGSAGSVGFVPNLYYAKEINSKLAFGIGLNAPFGLKTEYDSDWVGRYQAIKSELKVININPSLAWKVNNQLSLGAGFNAQYVDAELTKAIDFGTACVATFGGACAGLGLSSQNNDGIAKVEGDDWSYGFNLGALFELTPSTRIGVAYRSKVDQKLTGKSTYSNVPAAFAGQATFTDTGAKADLSLPETLSLSAFSQIDSKLALMADITWTHWSRFQELRVRFDNGAADSTIPQNWRNTYRLAVGASYQLNNDWKLRGGLAYDQSPVKDEFRTPRIPDESRRWIAFGATYNLSKSDSIDVGYQHGFVSDASMNKTEAPLGGTVVGDYDLKVDVVSLQYTAAF